MSSSFSNSLLSLLAQRSLSAGDIFGTSSGGILGGRLANLLSGVGDRLVAGALESVLVERLSNSLGGNQMPLDGMTG